MLKPGDVLKIAVKDLTGYLQYVGEHIEYGGVIWVTPRAFATPPKAPTDLIGDDGYYTFYPARTAIARGFAEVVGSAPLNGREVPHTLRRAGVRDDGGSVRSWIISYENGEEAVRTALSESEARLPIAAIWNHDMLTQRIADAWRPEHAS